MTMPTEAPHPIEPRYLDTADAAWYLGLAKHTLECWRSAGIGPAYSRLGRLIRYTKDDLKAWADRDRVAS
ncbi:helix-turn-helix domain-containing protein [Mycetocola saprophilus]|uniref:helix-turn-helix domain-containing protein n=1 Tax=Mycetocola saprophilus TaxID=76636 RepID=UPI0009DEC0D9